MVREPDELLRRARPRPTPPGPRSARPSRLWITLAALIATGWLLASLPARITEPGTPPEERFLP